jgi:hypothetical protein
MNRLSRVEQTHKNITRRERKSKKNKKMLPNKNNNHRTNNMADKLLRTDLF